MNLLSPISLDPKTVTRLLHGLARDMVDELLELEGSRISPEAFESIGKTSARVAMFLLIDENRRLEKGKKIDYLVKYILFTQKHCEKWERGEDGKFQYFIQQKPKKMVLELDKKLPR